MQLSEKISKNVIHKLCLIAAAKQVSGLVYHEVRLIILDMTEKLAKATALYTTHARRVTIQETDVRHALFSISELKNFHVMKNLKNVKPCKAAPSYDAHYSNHASYLRKIRAVQKQRNCLHLPKTIFRQIFKKYAHLPRSTYRSMRDAKCSQSALILAQIAIEDYLINRLQHAVRVAMNAKRIMLMPKDLHLSHTSLAHGNSHLLTDVNFKIYIYKLLKIVHPDTGMSASAKEQVQNILNLLGNKIALEAYSLTKHACKKTLSSREIQTAVRLVLPEELAKHAVTEGVKAVTYFTSAWGSVGSLARQSNLVFPPARAEKFLKEYNTRLGSGAKVYLAAVLEYLTAEILELSGNAARADRKSIITPRHIMLALANDEELDKLERRIGFHSTLGGVLPFIPSMYATKPKKSRKPKKKKSRKPKKKKSRKPKKKKSRKPKKK